MLVKYLNFEFTVDYNWEFTYNCSRHMANSLAAWSNKAAEIYHSMVPSKVCNCRLFFWTSSPIKLLNWLCQSAIEAEENWKYISWRNFRWEEWKWHQFFPLLLPLYFPWFINYPALTAEATRGRRKGRSKCFFFFFQIHASWGYSREIQPTILFPFEIAEIRHGNQSDWNSHMHLLSGGQQVQWKVDIPKNWHISLMC